MLKRARSGILSVIALMSLFAAPAVAQEKLIEGTWTGTIVSPEGQVFDVDYEIEYLEDELSITLLPPPEAGVAEIEAMDVGFEEELLTFSLQVGTAVDCVLAEQDDGRYEGACDDGSGESGILTMYPPE